MSRLFAISDIHGCFKPFHELIINTIKLTKSDQLILLGDYIDRGPHTKEVIDFILDLHTKGFNVITLKGNHEAMLMNSYNDPEELPLWLMNAGLSTLGSFGIQNIRDVDDKYLSFFNSLEYFRILGKAIFVHAGFDDFASNPFSDNHSMLWTSRKSYYNPRFHGKIVIHGHRVSTLANLEKLISEQSNVLPIDTGCVYEKSLGYGMLTALEVNSMEVYSVANEWL